MEKDRSIKTEYEEIIKLIEKKNYIEAEKTLTNLLNEKKDFYIHQLLGIVYLNTGDYEKAINHYNLSLNINPKNPGVFFNLGIIYQKLNNLDKSKESYLKSVEIDPNFIDAYVNLAKVYESEIKMHEANKYYLKAMSLNKDYRPLIKSYSKFLIKIGEVSKGMSFQYKYFGNIRFGKTNLKIN